MLEIQVVVKKMLVSCGNIGIRENVEMVGFVAFLLIPRNLQIS